MGFLEKMSGSVVYVDSAPFIYLIEKNEQYEKQLDRFFTAMDQGQFHVIVSTVVLAEVLVKPYRLEHWNLARKYESIFEDVPYLSLFPVDRKIARITAKLRATYSLLTPDAIHLATAIANDARFFLTNDRDFRKIEIADSQFPKLVFIDNL